ATRTNSRSASGGGVCAGAGAGCVLTGACACPPPESSAGSSYSLNPTIRQTRQAKVHDTPMPSVVSRVMAIFLPLCVRWVPHSRRSRARSKRLKQSAYSVRGSDDLLLMFRHRGSRLGALLLRVGAP